ncbi:MAG: site-specific DNA-methyltransferase [Chloroflexi bacterium]|nr:site-specific DNA-methyltransferase [Chloroflexota bacterium]
MARRKGPKHRTGVEAIRHEDTRKNIPTEELRDFIPDEEEDVRDFVRWPRDPSLDPQLVWQGKDALDGEELAVPVVPVYIQEKIRPRAIIEDLRRNGQREDGQLDFFADFNGIGDLERKLEFYQHEQPWSNRMILGDSLLVMTSLAEKESLRGKVQCIYIDPPYGIKFGSNWQVSTRKREVHDGRAEDTTRQPEQVRAFRDTWKLGIHSYLTYLRDRFTVARDLLNETGSIFVQISEENVHRVRALLDEVFGEPNFLGEIAFVKTSGLSSNFLADRFDKLLWYGKDSNSTKFRQPYLPKAREDGTASTYTWIRDATGDYRGMNAEEKTGSPIPAGYYTYKPDNITSQGNPFVEYSFAGKSYRFRSKTPLNGLSRLAKAGRLHVAKNSLQYVRRLDDFSVIQVSKLWGDTGTGSFTDDKIYVVQTGTKTVQRCILMTTDPGDLVLDPTCGSGTTAYVAEQWGRRWITTDTSRVALTLARTRLMAARYPYYLLADTPEGRAREAKVSGLPAGDGPASGDIRQGFVYKRAPHIQLRDIANNEEIDAIWERFQERLEPLRAALNDALGEAWQEWEIPREAGEDWPAPAAAAHGQWWEQRLARQREIDESIARNSESEILYDQPYEDNNRVRVAGAFTVESLSPHRMIAADEDVPASVREAAADPVRPDFAATIIENLGKAGVQNTKRDERLVFTRLDQLAGEPWIHAEGDYKERDGWTRRVAVSIGPEHGTVGAEQVERAARAAIRGVGYDLLVVCGFAFDARAGEKAQEFAPEPSEEPDEGRGFAIAESEHRYGKLPVMLARINPDLAMGDELLKKTGAGNLFTVFGEPDVRIERTPDDEMVVEIRGVDVYDPTTGEVRSSSTNDIACWFIDTNYDEQSFFVRHAYFTGDDEPYDRLKRALRAEIDEDAWASLYATRSRPFPAPASGKIAVKVINHYGDEVLKVYDA